MCKSTYKVENKTIWSISCPKAKEKVADNPIACALYATFFTIALGYTAFYIYFIINSQEQRMRLLTSVIEGCVAILLIALLIVWLYEYLLLMKQYVVKVEEMVARKKIKKNRVYN